MLSIPWENRKSVYDVIVIGSGYGGAITAARIATAALSPKPTVCVLERGREWPVGTFPDSVGGVLAAARSDLNPLGLYEFLNYEDISVIKGSGLGGTSLINANVAIVPDREVFERAGWPRGLDYDATLAYYDRARAVLAAGPHPRMLPKMQALDRRAQELGTHVEALNIAVNFSIDGNNPHGVAQKPCTDCGDCVTGCNTGAKNTLYMNYLPMARNAGAEIFTETKVEWIEKLDGGGWRVHGRRAKGTRGSKFTLDAKNVVLSAGSINSTEILLRSQMHGLPVSPALGTCFSGNGDFFGLAYNGESETGVLGYGTQRSPQPGEASAPGPSITGIVRYNGSAPAEKRITVEDFSFPSAYVLGAKALFATLRGDDTRAGNEDAERARILRDFDPTRPYQRDGALNHTMLYLVMGQDDARGAMVFDAPWFERDGRMKIVWDNAGQQIVFTRMNEELRRHARALGASYISNPTWSVFNTGHLITAHPLGGCPMGEDYLHGAVDQYGRVFSGDGAVHEGLCVADGAVIRSALGVNPFLTISALTERFAERKIRELGGDAYPRPAVAVTLDALDPCEVVNRTESELDAIFRRCPTLPIDSLVNQGGDPVADLAHMTVRNDRYWKGFFPPGHVLNAMSSALFTGFRKEFHKQGRKYAGITSDTDGRITARNSLEEIVVERQSGSLDPGRYILLRYLDLPWTGFYDVLKVIHDDLIIGRVYLGDYPNGTRLFTFAMTRKYGLERMTIDDHSRLFAAASVPSRAELAGVWRMDVLSNNNRLTSAAYLNFDLKPDGRLEARYQLMGLMEGLLLPSFARDHFRLEDFSTFHDEIRQVSADLMVGKYMTALPVAATSMGIFQSEPANGQFGFYYALTRAGTAELPTTTLLRPFLDVHLPDGVGMTFDEEMVGAYTEGGSSVPCSFKVRMMVRDVNEFIEGAAHEAGMKGSISFGRLRGEGPVTFAIDETQSLFNYLRVNESTGEAEMRYHIVFRTDGGQGYVLEGRKFMQKNQRGIGEVLDDYTTLHCRVCEVDANGAQTETGTALLKFRTFEDLAAVGNLAGFLGSFRVTGTDNPRLQLQAQMRFLAFTGQFVQREYDPLFAPPALGQAAGQG
ncbi:MAG: GMC family oxidoreductase [Acidobacteria bacterium]|nr:GMC family oxidoreductase [Acidobacteriota bacterium]